MKVGLALAAIAQVAMVVVFLRAGTSKVLTVGRLREAIRQLGMPLGLARMAAPAVVASEVVAAVSLAVRPDWTWPRAVVLLLAGLFAAAGLAAVATRRRIACHCFGAADRGRLGWRQMQLFPVWAGLAIVAQSGPPSWGAQDGLAVLAAVMLGLIGWQLTGALRTVRRLRGDRLAIAITYRGLSDEGAA